MGILEQYKNLSLAELEELANNYHRLHWSNGGASEFDGRINDISRAKIEAYRREHGQCFLGKINDYDQYGSNPQIQFVPYEGQMVYNFEYTVVIPAEDEVLRLMIKSHNTAGKGRNGNQIYASVEVIMARLAELGGITLSWS